MSSVVDKFYHMTPYRFFQFFFIFCIFTSEVVNPQKKVLVPERVNMVRNYVALRRPFDREREERMVVADG